MQIKKLNWAGVLIQSEQTVIMIDPLGRTPINQDKPFAARLGAAHEKFLDFTQLPTPTAIAITHIHPDHFDPVSIMEAFGEDIPLLIPIESLDIVKNTGLKNVIGVSLGEKYSFGEFNITATYSEDGYGTPQVSWIVEGNGKKIIHSGDTLWHGKWWKIAREFGRINVACFPINGAVLEISGLPEQSIHHACMTPEEAVEAARILGVERLIPIHFETFHNSPFYIETPDAVQRLIQTAQGRGVDVSILLPDQDLKLI